jgi:hypothetical protein
LGVCAEVVQLERVLGLGSVSAGLVMTRPGLRSVVQTRRVWRQLYCAYDDGVRVHFQLLAYPMLDDRTVLRKWRRRSRTTGLDATTHRYGWTS